MRGDGRTHCAEASAPAGPALSLGSRRHGGTWQGCGDVQGARAAPEHLPHAPSLKVFWGSRFPIALSHDPSNTVVQCKLLSLLLKLLLINFPTDILRAAGAYLLYLH